MNTVLIRPELLPKLGQHTTPEYYEWLGNIRNVYRQYANNDYILKVENFINNMFGLSRYFRNRKEIQRVSNILIECGLVYYDDIGRGKGKYWMIEPYQIEDITLFCLANKII